MTMSPGDRELIVAIFSLCYALAAAGLVAVGMPIRYGERALLVVPGFIGLMVWIVSWVVLRRYV